MNILGNNSIVEKWSGILDHEALPEIKDSYRKKVTAILMENQNQSDAEMYRKDPTQSMTYLIEGAPVNVMGASSSTASSGNIDI